MAPRGIRVTHGDHTPIEPQLRDRALAVLRVVAAALLFLMLWAATLGPTALAATAAIPMPDNPLDNAPPRAVADALARAWPRFATAAAGIVDQRREQIHFDKAPVALRINPDVDARTHAKITTGKSENKFGIPIDEAMEAFTAAG